MRKIILGVLIIILSFGIVSCGNETNPETIIEAKGKSGNLILYSLKDDTLCPIFTDNEANRQMLGIIYESLVRLGDNMEAEGVLAKSWSVSSDGLEWTFKLRDNVKWHNGDSFSAWDVVYTVEQIKASETESYSYNVRLIESVEASGGEVKFKLTEPCPNFVNLMTFPVIKKTENDIDKHNFVPCGTGAYVFSDSKDGSSYSLKRNNSWWGGKAKLETIDVKLLPDSETVAYSFSSGEIDIANSKWGKKNITGGTASRLESCSLPVYDYIGINHNDSILKNKEVRKAVNKAFKRDKIVNDVFAGSAVVASSPLRDNWFMCDGEGEYDADLTAAENLLLKNNWKKESGIYSKKTSDGKQTIEFEIIVNDDNSSRINIAGNLKLDLEAIGMSVTVTQLPFEEYESRILNGEYQLYVGSVMIPDDINLEFLLGEGNMFAYEDAKIVKILSDIKLSSDRESLVNNYAKLKERFESEIPIIGICFENFDMIYSKKVKGTLNSTPTNIYSGIYNLETVK